MKTKRIIAALTALMVFIWLFSVITFAAGENNSSSNALPIGDEELADNLPNKNTERWYRFENKCKGDVVVYLKNTDDITNVWRVALFDASCEREIDNINCTGSSYNKSYQSLDAGTYYLRITIGSTYEHESYDNLNYTVRVRTLSDVNIVPRENGAYVFDKAGQEMFILDERVYSKSGDGVTIAAIGYNYNGEPYVMLVGQSEEDVGLLESSYDLTKVTNKKKFTYDDGETYYYMIFLLYSRELKSELYVCNGGENTKYEEDNAYELMNLYNEKTADEGKASLWRHFDKDYGSLLWLGIFAGGFIALAVIVIIIKVIIEHFENRSYKRSRSSSYNRTKSISNGNDVGSCDDSGVSRTPDGTIIIDGETHNVYKSDAEGYSTGPYIEDAEGYKTAVDQSNVSAPFDWRDC